MENLIFENGLVTFESFFNVVKKKEVRRVKYNGSTYRVRVDADGNLFRMLPRSTTRGYILTKNCWVGFRAEDIIFNKNNPQNIVEKYIRLAKKATFRNNYIDKCLKADSSKSPYENGVTVGCYYDGKVITMDRVRKLFGECVVEHFMRAFKNGQDYRYRVSASYDYTISCSIDQSGRMAGYLSEEYKGCANGHYYLLINDENFIYYEKD